MSKKPKKIKILRDERGEYRVEWFFVNGKQRSRKIRLVEGIPVNEFIERNADDIYLVQEGMYEILHEREIRRQAEERVLDALPAFPSGIGSLSSSGSARAFGGVS